MGGGSWHAAADALSAGGGGVPRRAAADAPSTGGGGLGAGAVGGLGAGAAALEKYDSPSKRTSPAPGKWLAAKTYVKAARMWWQGSVRPLVKAAQLQHAPSGRSTGTCTLGASVAEQSGQMRMR